MNKGFRNKFSLSDKLRAVSLVLDCGRSFRCVSQEFSTCHRLISLWVACYRAHGSSGLSFKSVGHSADFKLSVLQDMSSNFLSLREVSVKYCLTPSVIRNWKRLYEQSGADALYCSKPSGRPVKMKKKVDNKPAKHRDKTFDALQKEVLSLRAENDYLKKLSALIQEKEAHKSGWKPLKN
jgi:transposase